MADRVCILARVPGGSDARTSYPVAHATEGGARLHSLLEHSTEVGRLAATFVGEFCDPRWGELAGRWHDLGKYAGAFQRMIADANGFEAHIEGDTSGPRDHSTAGAVHAGLVLAGAPPVISFAVAGHHAGLPDRAALVDRVRGKRALLDAALRGGVSPDLLVGEAPPLPEFLLRRTGEDRARSAEMWTRMVFSALCDADFLDTEAFYDSARAAERAPQNLTPSTLKARLDVALEALASAAPDTEVNRVRAEILAACRSTAAAAPGIFSLTVPTGGGKTLASMAFALEHALAHGLRRVVVAIPFTSIIEQSAAVYRSTLGTDAVIEHHSALDPGRETPRNRLAAENWDAPVIVTTTVQLFESLFANRPSACRKLHNLARSVIVLDEAQTLPPGLLSPILDALRTLAEDYGTTVVICTATQPALARTEELSCGLPDIREIVPAEIRAFERLRRVRVRWPASDTPTSLESVAQELAAEDRALAIVHLRKDARELFELVERSAPPGVAVHLSALMCAAHRSQVLGAVKQRLRDRDRVLLVATQLVEAGVDVDFPVVFRALAGLDSLAQAAGRCNREGRLPHLGELRVFVAESAPPPGVPRTAVSVVRGMLRAAMDEGREIDLAAANAFALYFAQLYGAKDLDAKGVQALRSNFDFSSVAQAFRLIEDGWSAPVVVAWGESEERLRDLDRNGPSRERLRALQRFTVTVPRRERDRWLASGAAREVAETVVALGPGSEAYDERLGLLLDRVGVADPRTLIA